MDRREIAERLIASRAWVWQEGRREPPRRKVDEEGGCGVIGLACSVAVPGRHLLQALRQMRNRGNGKGGGVALVGLDAQTLGVPAEWLASDYVYTVAYLDPAAREEVEREHLTPAFQIDGLREFEPRPVEGLGMPPPRAVAYFLRPREEALAAFAEQQELVGLPRPVVEDEFVYQRTYRLNTTFYASLGEKRAFVLSHGKDMLVLKMVGYGDDVVRTYGLEEVRAHVWIGHHRYPTKGRVWHPGGAHPFVGMHEALVHNGDFANYASVCTYLAQRNLRPLFLTDTEVSVLVFDLLHRTYGYPLEYVIEALAPTTERDFHMLPPEKQRIYRMLQTIHIHGSPDGPWFFLIAQSVPYDGGPRAARLLGITDTSMLRPQVFALQQGAAGMPSIGLAASEKQAIDAALDSLAAADSRFWPRADLVWNARGGSHTDGGAFFFDVVRAGDGTADLSCRDKFGRAIEVQEMARPYYPNGRSAAVARGPLRLDLEAPAPDLYRQFLTNLPRWSYEDLEAALEALLDSVDGDEARWRALDTLTLLLDRRYPTGDLRRSSVLVFVDRALSRLFSQVKAEETLGFAFFARGRPMPDPLDGSRTVIVDARGFPPEGPGSLALTVRDLVHAGFRRLLVVHCQGQRFLGSGLGPNTDDVRIDVYGSSGDYLASGIDGAEIVLHGNGQDQLAQIMKRGRLIVHGDVGQTFMYGAKGGEVFVLGSAAGRPLINAVGRPRAVINGTCLDYLAESFMAGDPLQDGGFVVLNGVAFDPEGRLVDLETPYPGGNLFSLASGGAIFIRDPRRTVGEDQLNGGQFVAFEPGHWELILPLLKENERLFGIPVERLLRVDGEPRPPEAVYRAIYPGGHKALQPEEAWVVHD